MKLVKKIKISVFSLINIKLYSLHYIPDIIKLFYNRIHLNFLIVEVYSFSFAFKHIWTSLNLLFRTQNLVIMFSHVDAFSRSALKVLNVATVEIFTVVNCRHEFETVTVFEAAEVVAFVLVQNDEPQLVTEEKYICVHCLHVF